MKESILNRWKAQKKNDAKSTSIKKAPTEVSIPLSYGQQRLWFLQQLHSKNSFYNYSESYILKGNLNKSYLLESLQCVFNANDILRTTFYSKANTAFQKVEEGELKVELYDLSSHPLETKEEEKNSLILKDAKKHFDLSEFPIVRVSLIKMEAEIHILTITMHHIITDKWSMEIFRKQMAKYYSALSLGIEIAEDTNALQYADYAFWQSKEKVDSLQLEYWKNKLSGELPTLDLAADNLKTNEPTFEGAFQTRHFSAELSKSVLDLSKKLETTPYVFLLSVYYVLLYRYTGQEDILIGSPISNRNNPSLEKLIGFFNNTVVLRTQFSQEIIFSDFVKQVRQTTLEAFSNNEVPFEMLVKELNPDRSLGLNPFFQVMFLYHSVPTMPSLETGLDLSHSVLDLGIAKFDLTLYIAEENGVLSATFEYATDVFKEAKIFRFLEHYEQLLKHIVKTPQQAISKLNMLTEKEERLFLGFQKEEILPYENDIAIHQIIDEIAKENKEAIAVACGGHEITYGELLENANKCASEILEISKGENEIVGLCAERSIDMIVGILGILKAGCAYLPIDPEYPSERVSYMLEDAKVSVVLTQKSVASVFEDSKINKFYFEDITKKEVTIAVFPEVQKNDLAYVIYTSGSTGKPKGVPITHQNIIKSTESRLSFYESNPTAFLLLSSMAFDSSKAGIFWTLCTGGKLVIGEKHIEQDMNRLGSILKKNGITHTLMLPSLYNLCLEHCEVSDIETLETVIVAGEACSSLLVENHFGTLPEVHLYNEYGPTEGTVWCIAHKVTEKDKNASVPIGKAVGHSDIYLLDKNHMLAPFGSIGEIFIGGPGLSGEYLNHPELTKTAYIKNPFDTTNDSKLYKTGDLGRYNSDGNIEFLGRADQQVKIRGHRIEIDEVVKIILQLPVIQNTVVSTQDVNGAKQLVSFIIASESTTTEEVKRTLKDKLPKHMIPSKIIKLDAFPQLPNGKVDRNALLEIGKSNSTLSDKKIDAPRTETQQNLIKIWEEVLKIAPIGINDNFFELGGDSILSIQIIAKARKMGIALTPSQLFEHQTVAELALFAAVSNDKEKEVNVIGEIPLTPIQHWFFDTHQSAPNFWNQGMKITGFSMLDQESVQNATKAMVARHDALRSTFRCIDGVWKGEVLSPEAMNSFSIIDVASQQLKDERQIYEKLEKMQMDLNLAEGPLFRCFYVDTGTQSSNYILLIAHHLVVDVVSWQIITDDFKALLMDKNNQLGPKTSSILDWTNHLNYLSNSDKLKGEINFWKEQVESNNRLPVDFDAELPLPEKSVEVIELEFDESITTLLTGSANDAFNTKVDELVLTALVETLSGWMKNENVSFAMERHGRETAGTSIDLSSTIGWFTAFFPITFRNVETDSIASKIIATKERMRSIPRGGIGYGALRYLTDDLGKTEYPQVVFNFLGKQTSKDDTIEFITEGVRHPLSERNYVLEINAVIKNGRLNMKWSYGVTFHKKSTIEKLITDFKLHLENIIEHANANKDGKFTPSDFPEADLSQDDLDSLLSQF